MADIHITITGAHGAGKTTLAKLLFGLFANTSYFVEEVEDSNVLDTQYIQDMTKYIQPRRRTPRTISLRIVERSYFDGVSVAEDDEE